VFRALAARRSRDFRLRMRTVLNMDGIEGAFAMPSELGLITEGFRVCFVEDI